MKIASGSFAWPGASVAVSGYEPMTMFMPAQRYAALREALQSSPKPRAPFVPPEGLATSLDLYEAWQRHEGRADDDFVWMRENGLRGLPLTARVIEAFPAFAEMGGGIGFYNGLHIAMDDGNLMDDQVDFCVRQTTEDGDEAAHALALQLREMTEDERIALYCSLTPNGVQEFYDDEP